MSSEKSLLLTQSLNNIHGQHNAGKSSHKISPIYYKEASLCKAQSNVLAQNYAT